MTTMNIYLPDEMKACHILMEDFNFGIEDGEAAQAEEGEE